MVQLTKPLSWVKLINTSCLLKFFDHVKIGAGKDFKSFLVPYTIRTSYGQPFLGHKHLQLE